MPEPRGPEVVPAVNSVRCGLRACEINPVSELSPAILNEPPLVALLRAAASFRPQLRSGRGLCTDFGYVVGVPAVVPDARLMWTHPLEAVATLLLVTLAGVWPLEPEPEVTRDFAPPAQEWGAGHRGVDLLGQPGQAVRAAVAGTVTYAGLLAGRGVVVVSHGETRTTYEPVAANVEVGDVVLAGQTIGTLRTFGSHCWPRTCLHWGLLEGDTYLNPLTLVGARPVRLLPLYSKLASPEGSSPEGLGVPALRPDRPSPLAGWELMNTLGDTPTAWSSLARPAGVPAETPDVVGPW